MSRKTGEKIPVFFLFFRKKHVDIGYTLWYYIITETKEEEKMTDFEKLAMEIGVKIELDNNGLYTGMCKALAIECNEIILSDDENIFNAEWEEQKKMIKENFYKTFPYMK